MYGNNQSRPFRNGRQSRNFPYVRPRQNGQRAPMNNAGATVGMNPRAIGVPEEVNFNLPTVDPPSKPTFIPRTTNMTGQMDQSLDMPESLERVGGLGLSGSQSTMGMTNFSLPDRISCEDEPQGRHNEVLNLVHALLEQVMNMSQELHDIREDLSQKLHDTRKDLSQMQITTEAIQHLFKEGKTELAGFSGRVEEFLHGLAFQQGDYDYNQ